MKKIVRKTAEYFLIGGTGVSPVKSGVPPDFLGCRPLLVVHGNKLERTSLDGFGRDTLNNRPEACATHRIFKARPNEKVF